MSIIKEKRQDREILPSQEDVLNAISEGKVSLSELTEKLDDTDTNQVYNILQAKMINPVFLEDNLDNTDELKTGNCIECGTKISEKENKVLYLALSKFQKQIEELQQNYRSEDSELQQLQQKSQLQ